MTHNQVKKFIKEELDNNVLYTAQVIVNPIGLVMKYPSVLPKKYYHHSTNKFGQQPFDERDGERMTLKIIGRLTTDKVDVLVVDNPNSSNEIPHITLATAEGVKPVQSNYELQENKDKIVEINDTVDTVFKNILKD